MSGRQNGVNPASAEQKCNRQKSPGNPVHQRAAIHLGAISRDREPHGCRAAASNPYFRSRGIAGFKGQFGTKRHGLGFRIREDSADFLMSNLCGLKSGFPPTWQVSWVTLRPTAAKCRNGLLPGKASQGESIGRKSPARSYRRLVHSCAACRKWRTAASRRIRNWRLYCPAVG